MKKTNWNWCVSTAVSALCVAPLWSQPNAPSQASESVVSAEAHAAGEELITKTYELSGLQSSVPTLDSDMGVVTLPVLSAGIRNVVSDRDPAVDAVVSLFTEIYWRELEFEGRWLEYDEAQRVSLRAPAALHKDFADLLVFYAQRLEESVPLQVDVIRYAHPSDVPRGLAPLADVDAWIAEQRRSKLVQSFVTSVSTSSIGSFQQQVKQPLMAEVDVEIAQGVAMVYGNPVEYHSGMWGTFLAHPTQGGIALDLQFMRSEAPSVREHKLELVSLVGGDQGRVQSMTMGGMIHLTDQKAAATGTAIYLPDGQVYLAHFHDAVSKQNVALAIRRLPSSTPTNWFETTGTTRSKVYATSALAFESRSIRWQWDGLTAENAFQYHMREIISYLGMFEGGSDSLNLLLGDQDDQLVEVWHDRGQVGIRSSGAQESSPEAQAAEVERLARRLESVEVPRKNYSVQIEVRGDAGSLLGLDQVVLGGREMQLLFGNEHSELTHHEVQIAERSGLYEPETKMSFEGLLTSLELHRIGETSLRVKVKGFYQWPEARTEVDFESPWHAAYETTRYGQCVFDGSRLLTRDAQGQWQATWGGEGPGMVSMIVSVREL